MKPIVKKTSIKLAVVIVITAGLITAFSIPLGSLPPLGSFLFPGSGVWNVPDEVANQEVLSVPELSQDVVIYRDEWGVPHIYGYSEADLVFGLGYVQAQDRLFQMDMARRLTRGRLSEILGDQALEVDKFSLNKLKDYWAEETWDQLVLSTNPIDIEIKESLLSYSAGINYHIQNMKALPLEYLFLDFEPEVWSPTDTISFVKYMSEMLTWGYTDINTLLLYDAIGLETYDELFGSLPYQIPITVDYGEFTNPSFSLQESIDGTEPDGTKELANMFRNLMNQIMKIPGESDFIKQSNLVGSNNWVVDGSKTASGKPILSNDMHLGYDLPGIWYEAHLVDQSPGSTYNVYGFFLAGVPYQIVGHNNYVAWGMTNTGIDVLDWYYYKGVNSTHYYYKDVPTPYTTIEYDIAIKGQEAEKFVIKSTIHGPVFNDLFDTDSMSDYTNDVFACRWISHNVTYETRAIYGWSHATNRAEFNEASTHFSTPAQNIIYADIHGDIGIRPTGRIPIRNDTNIPSWHFGNGTMPYNGSNGEGEWIGYIPFEDLPHSENPEQGYLASANQISAGPEFLSNYTIQNPLSVSSGYRARRINALLHGNDDITIEDMKELQLDVYSVKAGNFTPYLLDVINSISSRTQLQNDAYTTLSNWDLLMKKDQSAPTLFSIWIEIFQEETFNDEMDDLESNFIPNHVVLEMLVKTNSTSHWFDDINTPEVEDRDDIILRSFNIALVALETYFGTEDITQWIWGEINKLSFPHLTGLQSLSAGPYSVDGSGDTVNVIWSESIWKNGEVQESIGDGGASERLIVDLADLNNTLSIIPSGQRGISTSEHYIDQLEMFLQGEYHVQYFGADEIEKFQESWIESTLILKAGD